MSATDSPLSLRFWIAYSEKVVVLRIGRVDVLTVWRKR